MSRLSEDRRVECDGFYDGAHSTPLRTGLEEIDGKYEEKKSNLQKNTITSQKGLEAEVQHLDEVGAAIERKIRAVEEKNGEQTMTIVLPVCIVVLALLAIISEALLLAPAMDILNVTNEIAQIFTAFGIASVAGLTFHFVWDSFTSETFPRIWKVPVRTVSARLPFGPALCGRVNGLPADFAPPPNHN